MNTWRGKQKMKYVPRSLGVATAGVVTVLATLLMPIMASASPIVATDATPTVTALDPCQAGSNSSIASAIYKIVYGTSNKRVQIAQIVTSCRLSTENAADVTNMASQLLFGGTGPIVTLQDGSMVVTPDRPGDTMPVFWITGGKVFPAYADIEVDALKKDFFVVSNIEVELELED